MYYVQSVWTRYLTLNTWYLLYSCLLYHIAIYAGQSLRVSQPQFPARCYSFLPPQSLHTATSGMIHLQTERCLGHSLTTSPLDICGGGGVGLAHLVKTGPLDICRGLCLAHLERTGPLDICGGGVVLSSLR